MSKMTRESKREQARQASQKAASLGSDIDLSQYAGDVTAHEYSEDPSHLAAEEKANMLRAGVMLDDRTRRTGTYIQKDLNRTRERSGLIITHTGHILDYVHAGRGYVMMDGRISCEGEASVACQR